MRRRDIFHCQASAQLLSSKLYRIVLIRGSNFNCKLDLESVGSSLRFEGELIWAGLDWRGPDISSGLVNRHLISSGLWVLDFRLWTWIWDLDMDLDLGLEMMDLGLTINLGLGKSGPDIRPGLDSRHLIIEGHRGLRR